jgi:hypothetical protein
MGGAAFIIEWPISPVRLPLSPGKAASLAE